MSSFLAEAAPARPIWPPPGIEACKNNFRTRFVTCYGLVNELIEARQQRMLQRLFRGMFATICSFWTNLVYPFF